MLSFAHDFEVDGIYYNITSSSEPYTVEVTYKGTSYFQYYNEYKGAVTIPSSVTYNEIAYSVTSIGSCAFEDCYSLTSVNIPNSVTSIGQRVFSGCSSLTSVTAASGNTKYDSRENCNAIIETASNTLIAGCKNTIIPNSVTSIGPHAFFYCSGLKSVTIPNSVTSIGESAFGSCKDLTSVTIPNSVKSIGGSTFSYCTSLTSVTIPNSVTSIGESAFGSCKGLTSVTIPNSVKSIGSYAFSGCSGLTSVTIPNSVTSIGNGEFYQCSSLTSVTIPNSVTSIDYDAFSGCSALTSVTIPNSVTSIGWTAFYGCSGLTSVTIPNSVTSIGGSAFSNCTSLTSLTVASGNTKYDSRENCNAIIETASNTLITGCKNTIIPNSVTSIYYSAFSGCSGLTSVTIPNSVTTIDHSAFYNCKGLTTVTIPNSVTSIGTEAFYGCSLLKTIIIPQSLEVLYSNTYKGCTSVESVVVRKSMPIEIASDFFEESIYKNATLYVPAGRSKYFKNATGWENFSKIEEIEMEGVEISDSPYDNIEDNQMKLGYYTTDEISSNGYGGANAGHYRACIGFNKEQMAPFVGNSITNVRFALLNTDILNTKLWIGSTREKDDVYVQNVTTLKEGWNEVALSTPISITGDSIFIGIEYEQNGSNYPLSCLSEGAEVGSYYMRGPYNGSGKDEIWLDTSNSGRSLSLQCIVEGYQLPQYDIHTVKMELSEKYLKAGEGYYGYLYLRNWGKKSITSVTLACDLDGKEIATKMIPWSTQGRDITFQSIQFKSDASISPGCHTMNLRVMQINGEKPVFTTDDAQSVQVKFSSKDMGRDKVLLELYTATWCPNTPRAHKSIAKLMEERDDIVLVGNHIDDGMSCDASDAYSIFTQYTPTIFYNRYASYGGTSLRYIDVDKAKATPSLAKLSIEAEYAEGSREAHITVKGVKNDEFDAVEEYANLTVLLTEDNVVAPQNDRESGKYIYDYVHNGVLRTNVSDIWGDPIVWNGDTFEKNYTVKLNEDWVKDNMRVVAFLAKPFNGSNYDEIELVNCNDYALKNAPVISGITLVQQTPDIMLFDNGGSIGVKGNYSDIQVYTPYGVKVGNRNLQAGTYIVKVKTQQGNIIKKINIR